jgi:hypothetical protein
MRLGRLTYESVFQPILAGQNSPIFKTFWNPNRTHQSLRMKLHSTSLHDTSLSREWLTWRLPKAGTLVRCCCRRGHLASLESKFLIANIMVAHPELKFLL